MWWDGVVARVEPRRCKWLLSLRNWRIVGLWMGLVPKEPHPYQTLSSLSFPHLSRVFPPVFLIHGADERRQGAPRPRSGPRGGERMAGAGPEEGWSCPRARCYPKPAPRAGGCPALNAISGQTSAATHCVSVRDSEGKILTGGRQGRTRSSGGWRPGRLGLGHLRAEPEVVEDLLDDSGILDGRY